MSFTSNLIFELFIVANFFHVLTGINDNLEYNYRWFILHRLRFKRSFYFMFLRFLFRKKINLPKWLLWVLKP